MFPHYAKLLFIFGSAMRSLAVVRKMSDPSSLDMSLLQADAARSRTKVLPQVKKVLEKPHQVLEGMTSKVDMLMANLAQAERENVAQVQARKQEYEATLQHQAAVNHAMEKKVHQLHEDIAQLESTNMELRDHARELESKNKGFRSRLAVLRANMTTAQEFSQKALDDAGSQLHQSSHLDVLAELDAKEQAMTDEKTHEDQLLAITGAAKLSLLEVSAERNPKETPGELLAMMTSGLDDLAKERNASLAMLKQSFDDEFAVGEQRRQELVEKAAQLNETKAAKSELHGRLIEAVSHLDKTSQDLLHQIGAIEKFLFKISGNPEPIEKAADKAAKKSHKKHMSTLMVKHEMDKPKAHKHDDLEELGDAEAAAEDSLKNAASGARGPQTKPQAQRFHESKANSVVEPRGAQESAARSLKHGAGDSRQTEIKKLGKHAINTSKQTHELKVGSVAWRHHAKGASQKTSEKFNRHLSEANTTKIEENSGSKANETEAPKAAAHRVVRAKEALNNSTEHIDIHNQTSIPKHDSAQVTAPHREQKSESQSKQQDSEKEKTVSNTPQWIGWLSSKLR